MKGRIRMTLLARSKPDAYIVKQAEKEKLENDKTSLQRARSIAEAAEKFEKACIRHSDIPFSRK